MIIFEVVKSSVTPLFGLMILFGNGGQVFTWEITITKQNWGNKIIFFAKRLKRLQKMSNLLVLLKKM